MPVIQRKGKMQAFFACGLVQVMVSWIISNMGNIIVSILVVAVVAFVIFKMVSDRRKGKSSCGCGCSDCAMNGQCHKK